MTIIYAALHNKSSALHHIEPNHRFFLAKQHWMFAGNRIVDAHRSALQNA
jgi:hypothetical protein